MKCPKSYVLGQQTYVRRAILLSRRHLPKVGIVCQNSATSTKCKGKTLCELSRGVQKGCGALFWYLQARWAIVRGAARMFDVELLRSSMMTCIILHNMIVEDEYDYDVVDEYEPNTMNNSRTCIYYAHDTTKELVQHEPLERGGRYNELIIQRYTALQRPYMHNAWQNDLIEHQWTLKQAEDN
ncbi:hypothetical protein ACFX15_032105 [Malus domestica]